jgi:virulence factor Mce-like protein
VIGVALYGAFVRTDPFAGQFTLRGVFANSSQLDPGNPVRLDGVAIGQVAGVAPGLRNTSVVTMTLAAHTDLLHQDATLTIKPRLLFEGNFYVEIAAGSPGAPPLRSGTTIPVSRTQTPVQVDQVLDVLSAPIRQSLTGMQASLAQGLGGAGPAGHDGLRAAVRELDRALPSVRVAAGAIQGAQPGDLTHAVADSAEFTTELARDPSALGRLVIEFNQTVGALAANDVALGNSVSELDRVMRTARPSLTAIDSALPTLSAFTDQLRPALRIAPSSLAQTTGLLNQLERLAIRSQLPALMSVLRPVTTDLPPLIHPLATGLSLLTHASRCMIHPIIPALNAQLPDGPNSTGYPIWLDIIHAGANLLGASAGFDGNGGTLRLGLTEGANAVRELVPGLGQLVGYGNIEGDNPEWLGAGALPPFRPDAWCDTQPVPDYAARNVNGVPVGMQVATAANPAPQLTARLASEAKLLLGGPAGRKKLLGELISRPAASHTDPPRDSGQRPTVPLDRGPGTNSAPSATSTAALSTTTTAAAQPTGTRGSTSRTPSPPNAGCARSLSTLLSLLTGHDCASPGAK